MRLSDARSVCDGRARRELVESERLKELALLHQERPPRASRENARAVVHPACPSEGEDKAVWQGHRLQLPLINRNDPVEMPGLTFGRLLLALGLGLAMCLLLIRNIGPQSISLGALPSAVLPPFLAQSSPHGADLPPTALGKLKRVAIVGAGASGSAAAFFLERAARSTEGEGEIELVVFERDARVGGRSTTVRPYGPEGPEGEGEKQAEGKDVELGASIFVSRPAVPGSCLQQSAAPMLTPMSFPLYLGRSQVRLTSETHAYSDARLY